MTMRGFPFFIGIATLFLPINITIATIGSKPVDIVLSDLLLLCLFPVFFLFNRNCRSVHLVYFTLALLVYTSYCLLSILTYQIVSDGGAVAVASFLRSLRAFFLFFVGFYFYEKMGRKIYLWSAIMAVVLTMSLIVSDMLFNVRWPAPRWGGNLYSLEVYGFPNSPAFFYIIVASVLLYAVSIGGRLAVLSAISLLIMMCIIVLVGSRNAIACLALLFFVLAFMRLLSYRYAIFMAPFLVGAFYYIATSDIDMHLLTSKFHRSFSEGVLYGRESVWEDVMSLVMERPLMGYGYDPLTDNYQFHGTAHNQYIEYVYKMGFFGFVFISVLWFSTVRPIWKASNLEGKSKEDTFLKYILASFGVCLFSNFFQPNLTYSVTQAFFCFFGGVAASVLSEQKMMSAKK